MLGQRPPIIVSEVNSTRAIALDSVTLAKEPFQLSSRFARDGRTRVIVFVLNLPVAPGVEATLAADVETANHLLHALLVEKAFTVDSLPWLTGVVLRLNDDLSDAGDVLLRLNKNGLVSNRVRVAIGSIGGGPADDDGANPTPAPPYVLRGRITNAGQGFSGVSVSLSGDQTQVVTTDATGAYSFVINSPGNYTLTPTRQFFDFNPVSKAFNNLSGNQSDTNFIGGRRLDTVSGRVLSDESLGIDGVTVNVLDQNNSNVQSTTSTAGGNFILPLPAGFTYKLVPISTPIFTFVDQAVPVLDGDVVFDLRGVRRKYSVSGVVTDATSPVANTVVTLSGSQSRTARSDSNGNYLFADLDAGRNYTLTIAPTALVQFPPQTVTSLTSHLQFNFASEPRDYIISGSVVGSNNTRLSGVLLRLTGSRTALTRTDANGNYAFTVKALDNVTVTPSIEQELFNFTPTQQSLVQNIGDRVINFAASQISFPNPPLVLEFDGTPKTVDYGNFFPAFTDLGHFFWEFWAMPGGDAGATYVLSDGYGGAHALLFGVANFNTSEHGRYQLLGNINDGIPGGDHIFYFHSDQGPAPNEWGHIAVGWDGANIITYFNGVPVGKTPYNRARQSMGIGNGAGRLLIGGSDHSNFVGRIAEVRGYEGTNPRELQSVEATFAPQTIFTPEGNLLSYYFRSGPYVADISRGFLTGTHVGTPRGTLSGILGDCGPCPPPQFVLDTTAPNFVTNTPASPVILTGAPPTPAGELVFDSFSRANSTYMFGNKGGLGSTETGSAGPLTWQTPESAADQKPFGILNGLGVLLGNSTALTWVNPGAQTGDLDIRVDRWPGRNGTGTNTGLSFRVMDASNYFFAYTTDSIPSPGRQFITLGYYSAGSRTILASFLTPLSWTTLRVITGRDGSIQLFTDSTLLYSTSNATLADATGAGLFNNGPGLGLTNRWDNFTIFRNSP